MSSPQYDYYGLVAGTWDLHRTNTHTWSDRFFYLDIIRRFGQPVLDIGCGTGRLTIDYAAQGIDIDGVDNSPEMLAICRAKAQQQNLSPGLFEQPMEQLALPRRYRTILAPSSALQLVPDPDMARATMRRIVAHLEPGGALVGSFGFEWHDGDPLDTGWTLHFEVTRPEDGAIVRSWERERRDPASQCWHTEQRFEVELNGQIIQTAHHGRSPEGRWYSQAQAADLFREAGLVDVRLFHEFTHERAREGDRFFCVLGVQPPA